MYKKIISVMSVALVVFLCFTFPANASSVSIEERFNTTDVQNQDPDDTDKKIVINTYNTISRPYYVQYDYDFTIGRTYYGTSTQQFPANPYNWQSSDIAHLYQVDYTSTITISNRYDYLAYGDIGYISVLPDFTFNKNPSCYWVECVTDGLVLSDVTNNGTLKFRYAPSDYSYYGRLAVPGNAAINVTFIIHFMYSDYYNYQNGNAISNGGTLFGSSVNYMDINSVSLVQPTYWVLTNVDVNGNHLVNEWKIIETIKSIYYRIANSNQAYNDNQQNSQDVTDQATDVGNTVDTQHQAESNYFQDNQTAINDTGIGNFQFDSDTTSGLNGIKDDFTAVWTACGGLSKYWIASLTIGLALSIIRHRRMFEK